MYLCICNALTEEDVDKMSLEDYEKVKQCGVCEKIIRERKSRCLKQCTCMENELEQQKLLDEKV